MLMMIMISRHRSSSVLINYCVHSRWWIGVGKWLSGGALACTPSPPNVVVVFGIKQPLVQLSACLPWLTLTRNTLDVGQAQCSIFGRDVECLGNICGELVRAIWRSRSHQHQHQQTYTAEVYNPLTECTSECHCSSWCWQVVDENDCKSRATLLYTNQTPVVYDVGNCFRVAPRLSSCVHTGISTRTYVNVCT